MDQMNRRTAELIPAFGRHCEAQPFPAERAAPLAYASTLADVSNTFLQLESGISKRQVATADGVMRSICHPSSHNWVKIASVVAHIGAMLSARKAVARQTIPTGLRPS
jgi:hypothetical protein